MACILDAAFDGAHLAADAPPLRAYGLAPSAAGFRLADLRCAAQPRRVEGVYSEFAVGLVLSGAFDYDGGTRTGTSVPGSFVFGNKQEAFSCRHLGEEGNRRLVLFFDSALIEAIADDLALSDARFPVATAPPSPLTSAVSAHMLTIARGADDSEEAAAAVAETALRTTDGWDGCEKTSAAEARRIVDAVRYINANFASPCTLDVLASVASMSRFRFARRFRAVTGETANQYVLNRRLSAAAARLAATRAPVLEIAYDVGFNDLSYFYARFKAAFGCAPGVWRRRQAA
jgi:AraC family transcriptional regulator